MPADRGLDRAMAQQLAMLQQQRPWYPPPQAMQNSPHPYSLSSWSGLSALGGDLYVHQQQMNALRSMQQDVREMPPSPPPKRLIDMKGAEAVKHMLASARRELVGKG